MGEKLKIDVTLETREAERESARTRAELGALEQSVGRLDARTKDFRRTLEGGTSQASALGRQLKDALAGVSQQDLAAIRGNVGAAFEAVRGAAETMTRSAGEAERLGRANRQLGLDYQDAARGAGGVLDELQLLNATQALTARGIQLNQAQLNAFGRAAQDYARSTGREFNSVAEQLAEVVAKGGEESARFGGELAALAAPTNTAAQRLDALTQSTQGTVPAARTSAEAYRDLTQAVTDAERAFAEGFAEGLAELSRVQGETRSARDAMRELKDDVFALGGATATVFGALAAGAQVVTAEVSGMVSELVDAVETFGRIQQSPLSAGSILRAYQQRSDARDRESEEALRRLLAIVRGEERTTLDAAGDARGAARPRPRGLMVDTESGIVGTGSDEAFQQANREAERGGARGPDRAPKNVLGIQMERAIRGEGDLGAEVRSITGVSRAARLEVPEDPERQRLLAIDRRNAEANRRQAGGTLGDRLDARESARRSRELEEQIDAQQSYTDRMREMHSERISLAQAEAEAVSMGFASMGRALGAHVNAVVAGRESIGDAAKAVVADTLTALGQEAVVKGAMQIAEGLAMLAGVYTAPLAPAHFAAGAAFMAVGGLVGAAGAALSPSAGASPSGAAAGPPSAPVGALAAANDNGRGGPTQITINLGGGMVLGTPRELGEALSRAINDPLAGVQINPARVRAA